jgi:hypothetical protein
MTAMTSSEESRKTPRGSKRKKRNLQVGASAQERAGISARSSRPRVATRGQGGPTARSPTPPPCAGVGAPELPAIVGTVNCLVSVSKVSDGASPLLTQLSKVSDGESPLLTQLSKVSDGDPPLLTQLSKVSDGQKLLLCLDAHQLLTTHQEHYTLDPRAPPRPPLPQRPTPDQRMQTHAHVRHVQRLTRLLVQFSFWSSSFVKCSLWVGGQRLAQIPPLT